MRIRTGGAIIAAAAVLLTAPGVAGASTHHGGDGRKARSPQPTIVDLAVATPDLSILVQAVQKAGLAGPLADRHGDYTVFAPTNEAFVALLGQLGLKSLDDIPVPTLRAVLLDHVLSWSNNSKDLAGYARRGFDPTTVGGLRLDYDASPAGVNDAAIVASDIKAANGYVFVIDKVLQNPDPRPTIAGLAVANPDLSILVQAAQKAGLVDALSNPSAKLTVFAPTNEAFVALLGQLGLASLDDVPVDTLRSILLDHVVPKELDAADVLRLSAKGRSAHTLGGLDLHFTTSPLQVNGVDIVATDVEGSNGTVHVINSVLLAPAT